MPARIFKGLFDTVLSVMKEEAKATYTPKEGPPSTEVDVVFLSKHQEVDDFGVAYGAPQPTAWVKVGAITPPADYGDTLEINGIIYTVREEAFDGNETNKLTLEAP